MPLSSLVDKVLESKAKELLPKISEVVEKLRETKTSQSPSIPSSLSQSSGQTAEKNMQEAVSKAKPTDFGSLPLPIDIPGLSSSTSGNGVSPTTKKEPSEGKPPLKPKPKPNEGSTTKENKAKGKSGQPPKVPTTVKEGLKREKEVISEKDTVTEEGNKERDKHKLTTKQKRTRDNAKDKGANLHKEKSHDSKLGAMEKNTDPEVHVHARKVDSKLGNGSPTNQQEHYTDPKLRDSTVIRTECTDSEVQNDPKKVLPPRRRSARIASLSESVEDAGKEEGDSDEHQGVKDKTCEGETVDRNINKESVKTKSSSNLTKRKRKRRVIKSESQKKRPRLLSSSSDEEIEVISSEEEPDQALVIEENRKHVNKGKSNQTSNRVQSTPSVKRSRKRVFHQVVKEETPASIPQKKSRGLDKNFNDSTTAKSVPSSEPQQGESLQKPHRRKSSQPQRLLVRASKSPPVVVTRYNRQIKPNRRYLDTSGEQSEAESEQEEGAGEEKMSVQDQEEAYSDIDSSEHEESGQED